MIGISIIGTGDYQPTKYKYQNKSVNTPYFPFAFNQFIKPDKLFILMTEEAKRKHLLALKEKLDFQEIIIPFGKSEEEFWDTFDIITKVIESQSDNEISFDITHGFRSQPFIIISLLLYLRALKKIEIENILYGAFEAKNGEGIAPVFDLKPFIDLIDWSNAVHEFTENGNMKYFNDLLSNIHKNSYLKKLEKPSKQLKSAGSDLSKLTDAFSTIRLKEIFENTYAFNQRIESLKQDLENNPQAKPFGNLIKKISEQFNHITRAEKNIFSEKGFTAQKSIMQWYIETGKYQKAITLAREFIISKYLIEILKTNSNCLLEKGCRIESENELGKLMKVSKNGMDGNDRKSEYGKLWVQITDVRNDINHAGMRKNPKPTYKLIASIKNIIKTITEDF